MYMEKPLASILIASYNAERYIRECIDSALAQTYPNIEVVIVDDGSKDGSRKIIKEYRDPRIRYYEQENLGIPGVRNRLLREAKGDFLTYLDCDDIYLPDKVKEEVNFLMTHTEYAAVYCELLYFFDELPNVFYRHVDKHFSGDAVFVHLLDKMFITNTAFMMRRSVVDAVGFYTPETGIVEDWDYFLRMTHQGYKIAFLDRDLVKYRLRWDSNTNFKRQVEIKHSQVMIFEKLKDAMTGEERKRHDIDHWIARRKENLIITLFSVGKKRDALAVMREIKGRLHLLKKLAMWCMVVVPSPVLRFAIEKAWNQKKKNLFVPVR